MIVTIIIPSIRPESYAKFKKAWQPLFDKHDVSLVTVWDGKEPKVVSSHCSNPICEHGETLTLKEIMGKYSNCIVNFNGGIRNLGFAYVAKYQKYTDIIITLDDDTRPIGDPIQDHIDILNKRVPISWLSTASEYMRGFPYKIREEAEVVLSHGVWEGIADWDAPTQLVKGNQPVEFYKGPIPKGIYFPMCIMNTAFKFKMLPWMYQAPPAPELNIGRTDDIFCGILAKREIDKQGLAAVSGYASVLHERESNVYKNLQLEAKTIELMETFWQGDESHPYFKIYREKLKLWQEFINAA